MILACRAACDTTWAPVRHSCTMYAVKRYTSSQVRERLSDVLDEVERGEEVVIERRGARFLLHADRSGRPKARRRGPPAIEILDPAVAKGEWTWTWKPAGLAFTKRARR